MVALTAISTIASSVLPVLLKRWKEVTIVALIAVIIIMRSCSPSPSERPEQLPPIVIQSTPYTPTITSEDNTYYLKFTDIKVVKEPADTIFFKESGEVDSLAILKDWLTKRDYIDTLINNDTAFLWVHDQLLKNKIFSREFGLTIHPQPIYIPELRTKVFVGFGANGWMDKFGVNATLALLTKKDHLYSVYYDPINQNIGLLIYWKLSFRKNR